MVNGATHPSRHWHVVCRCARIGFARKPTAAPAHATTARGSAGFARAVIPATRGAEFDARSASMRASSACFSALSPLTRAFNSAVFLSSSLIAVARCLITGLTQRRRTLHPTRPAWPRDHRCLMHFRPPRGRCTASDASAATVRTSNRSPSVRRAGTSSEMRASTRMASRRMSAQFEEIVVDADAGHVQNGAPGVSDLYFERRTRCDEFARHGCDRSFDEWQRATVKLFRSA